MLKWPFVDLTIDLGLWNWILESGKHGLSEFQFFVDRFLPIFCPPKTAGFSEFLFINSARIYNHLICFSIVEKSATFVCFFFQHCKGLQPFFPCFFLLVLALLRICYGHFSDFLCGFFSIDANVRGRFCFILVLFASSQ